MTTKHGKLFVVSGPSGAGKTVLCSKMLERFQPRMVYSISATSRNPRGAEKDGAEYFFYSPERFEREIKDGCFAEWAKVHGNYYGTPRAFVDEKCRNGFHVLLNIDVQGALKIKVSYPDAVMVFIQPPSLQVLEERLRRRNMDSEESLRNRLANAKQEMECSDRYQHVLINDDLAKAEKDLEQIFLAHDAETRN